jgi:hypothetical protein
MPLHTLVRNTYAIASIAGVLLFNQSAKADLLNNSTGLSNPATTLTFGTNDFPEGTPITNQYAAQGLANGGGLLYSNQSYTDAFNGSSGAYLLNFDETEATQTTISPFTLTFTTPQNEAALVFVTNFDATIAAQLNGVTVQGFTVSPQNTAFTDTFYGFTNITFDSIQITTSVDNLAFIDTLQLGTATAVPEPGSIALLAGMGLSGAGFLARRRKNTRQAA